LIHCWEPLSGSLPRWYTTRVSDSDERAPGPGTSLAARTPKASQAGPPTRPAPRQYHVALTAKEALERLSEQPGVKTYARSMMPDFGGLLDDAEYTIEIDEREFTMHAGPPAARGQSATGMLRLLYLRGRLIKTEAGTRIELRFAYRRPRWALQRWVGFLALASLGLLWVLIGPGILAKKALLYGGLLAVLAPVVVHDLRRAERIEEQRLALLNLIEHAFGSIQIDDAHLDEPYRRRALARVNDDDDIDSDDDDDDDDESGSSKIPENT
jgi:hypothetical protein